MSYALSLGLQCGITWSKSVLSSDFVVSYWSLGHFVGCFSVTALSEGSWSVLWCCLRNAFQSSSALHFDPSRPSFPTKLAQLFLGSALCLFDLVGWRGLGAGSCSPFLVTGLALLLTFPALSMYHGYGFVQYDRLEDVQAALDGEKGRLYKGYRLGKENWSLLFYWP